MVAFYFILCSASGILRLKIILFFTLFKLCVVNISKGSALVGNADSVVIVSC